MADGAQWPNRPGLKRSATAAALFGLSRIGLASPLNDTILWFLLLGLGLSPVIVGATDVIVGNAPVELAGVAGGLQSTAMQVGGTIGTAALGAIMSVRVDSLLPARWAAAHLPPLSPTDLAGLKELTTVGATAPPPAGIPPHLYGVIAYVTHSTFISGMNAAFLAASIVALGGAAVALLTRRGHVVEEGAVEGAHAAETAHAAENGRAAEGAPVEGGHATQAAR